MVILVLVSAVTLSPMFKVMGLRSCASIAFGFSEMSMIGLDGSANYEKRALQITKREVNWMLSC